MNAARSSSGLAIILTSSIPFLNSTAAGSPCCPATRMIASGTVSWFPMSASIASLVSAATIAGMSATAAATAGHTLSRIMARLSSGSLAVGRGRCRERLLQSESVLPQCARSSRSG